MVCPILISVSLAPASYFFSAAQTNGAGRMDAAVAANTVAPNSRRGCLFFILILPRSCPDEGSGHDLVLFVEHDLFSKPATTLTGHAVLPACSTFPRRRE